ncbi:MAG: class I adenylate-forming enzyme family protein [Mariprofundaceae bacterium]|nr:class I adenylate-forming enzyme family protein [Mariprofundaceae bacterium]
MFNKNYATRFDERDIALNDGTHQLSYGELRHYIQYLNQQMEALSITEEERVLILLPNGIHHIIAVFAAFSLGCVVVPMDIESSESRLKQVVESVQPVLCITFLASDVLDGVQVLNIGNILHEPNHNDNDILNVKKFERAKLLLFSSGSTGQPKGVVITYQQQAHITKNIAARVGTKKGDKELLLAPSSHSDGWQRVMVALYSGAQIVFPQGLLSVSNILETIAEEKITTLFIHPTLLRYLLKAKKDKVIKALQSCHSIKTGGASLLPDELERFLSLVPNANVYVHYGMSESPRSTMASMKCGATNLHSVGTAMAGVTIMIADLKGQPMPCGEIGEILIQGLHLSSGYWNQTELFNDRFHDGWLHTGDFGSMDEQGALYFHGRKDDVISTSGYSFYPAEVETLLGMIPDVQEYLVLGIPDPKGMIGDEPWLFLIPEEDSQWEPKKFYDYAKPRLEKHMMPRRMIVVSSIPKTASGKANRKEMIEQFKRQGRSENDT